MVQHILDSINNFYGDTNRSRSETKEGLEEIGDLIDSLLDTLEDEEDEN